MTKTAPSLRDVAQAAGVSLGTASRALNNKANVLPATRALVLKAAADIGYQLQIRVPTTVASKINTIGVVVKRDPGEHPRLDQFNYTVLCGVEDECERLGLNLMYASLPVNEFSHATTWSSMLESGDVDGLVIIGIVFSDVSVTNRIPQHIPVVVVDAAARGVECDVVLTNNAQGAYEAVSYLIAHGHSKIGLIGSSGTDEEHPSIHERRCGYLKALAEYGIEATYVEDSLLNGDSAYSATIRLLNRVPDISAVFACNDDVAMHVIRALRDLGRRVPEDVSVIGFDDTAGALDTQPPLTTIHVYKELMGALAVRQLYERAADIHRPPITTLIGAKLVQRDSVARFASRQTMPET
ncbi:MAG TPA: LacI family DNA-binding transcriptional regulator [Phototrophicaceae bacterium]|nr:LacI family DNA-binding transcriptional regulator [Phototrophicaceae bacterium]